MRSVVIIGLVSMLGVHAQMQRAAAGGSYIGVMMQEVDGERAKALKLGEASGVEVTLVEPDGPAEKAGLKVGDILLRYNGQHVEGNEQFARLVRETPPGHEVKVDILRAGAPQSVSVRVAQRKVARVEWGASPTFDIHMPEMPRNFVQLRSSILGVEVESIDGQLAQYFGVKEGALVRSVGKGSAADKAGVRAGDVILKLDDARVTTPMDIATKLRMLHGKSASMALMRDHKEMTVTVMVSDEIQMTPFQVHPNQP